MIADEEHEETDKKVYVIPSAYFAFCSSCIE